jgi:hypothetical protein
MSIAFLVTTDGLLPPPQLIMTKTSDTMLTAASVIHKYVTGRLVEKPA